jgi:two-component sensor histidine kinase
LETSGAVDRSSSFTFKAAVALIVLLFVLFPLAMAASVYQDWKEAGRRGGDRAFAASQVVATNARWISELSRQALGRIDEALGGDIEGNVAQTSAMIRDAVSNLPGNAKSYVVAADGRTLFSTDPNVKPIDVRDRDYFAAVAAGANWYVSPLLVSRLDNAQIFVFSKRLERRGEFAGAAIISFDVAILREIWESLELEDKSTISIIRDDGQLIARYPFAEGPLDLSGYVLFTQYLAEKDAGTYPAVSPADNITRIVGYRRVPETNFIALASVSTEAAFAQFWRNTKVTLAFALPTGLLLAGAVIWIFQLLRIEQNTRVQLFEALQLNRMLVRDTHHRVKNNLQSIMSMVRMHELPEELKSDLQIRIAAMAAVHEHIYRLDRYAEVDATALIPGIVDPMLVGYAQSVEVKYDIDPLLVDHDHATPLALLVSELVTNSLKYAFPNQRPGTIWISFKKTTAGKAKLIVSDDGVGFDPQQPAKGLGSRLVKAMLIQLNGSSSYTFGNGTTFDAELSIGARAQTAPFTKHSGALSPI